MNGQLVRKDVTAVMTHQIEIGVAGRIDDRGLIRDHPIIDEQIIGFRQCIADLLIQITGETLLQMGADSGKFHPDPLFILAGNSVIKFKIRPFAAAMQIVAVVVLLQLISNAIQNDLTVRDPVSVTTYKTSKFRSWLIIRIHRIITQNHTTHSAVNGQANINDRSTEIGQRHFHTGAIGQDVFLCLLSIPGHAPGNHLHFHHSISISTPP